MTHIPPYHLYKYKPLGTDEDVRRTLDIIETGTIFAPTIDLLNDPFEGSGVTPHAGYAGVSFPRAVERMPSRYKTDVRGCRVLSLTEDPVSPQMWAYYAGNYTGACLQLDPIALDVQPMRYAERPYRIDGIRLDGKDGDAFSRARLLSKHIGWSHEQEWRAICSVDNCPEFVELGAENPCAVILGHCCSDEYADAVRGTCYDKGVPVYETYISDWKYQIRVVPFGFRAEYSGIPLYEQVREECRRQGVPMFETW